MKAAVTEVQNDADPECNEQRTNHPTPPKGKRLFYAQIFASRMKSTASSTLPKTDEGIFEQCKSEFNLYLGEAAAADHLTDPLEWWAERNQSYPTLAILARKWFGYIATSVPSERAFSTRGNVMTVKRCSLDPETLRDIVFVSTNCKR